MTISEAIKKQAMLSGDGDTLFECADWSVSVTRGVLHKSSDTDVTWDEVEQVRLLSIKTSNAFEKQPWPFWGSKEFTPDWFYMGSYKAAMCYAIGYLTLAAWNQKAEARRKNLYTN